MIKGNLTVDDITGYTTLEILLKLLELYNILAEKVNLLEEPDEDYLQQLQVLNDMIDHIIPFVRGNTPPLDGLMLQHEGFTSFAKKTYGRFEDACVVSIDANVDDAVPEVVGTDTYGLGTYTNRDSVALYVSNHGRQTEVIQSGVAYQSNGATFINGVPSSIKVGSILDTGQTVNVDWYVGIVKSISGNQITLEDGWYLVRNDGNAPTKGIPSGSLRINMNNKLWCINSNLFIDNDCPAGANMELGVISNHTNINDVGGIDLINMGVPTHYGIKVRGRDHDFRENIVSLCDSYHLSCYGDGDIIYSTPNTGTALPYYIKCDGRQSKEMYNFSLVDNGTQYYMKNDDVTVLVTCEGINVQLPSAEVGRRCQIISKSSSCVISFYNGSIGTKTGSYHEISGNLQGENVLRTIDFVSDGNHWYVTQDSNWVY